MTEGQSPSGAASELDAWRRSGALLFAAADAAVQAAASTGGQAQGAAAMSAAGAVSAASAAVLDPSLQRRMDWLIARARKVAARWADAGAAATSAAEEVGSSASDEEEDEDEDGGEGEAAQDAEVGSEARASGTPDAPVSAAVLGAGVATLVATGAGAPAGADPALQTAVRAALQARRGDATFNTHAVAAIERVKARLLGRTDVDGCVLPRRQLLPSRVLTFAPRPSEGATSLTPQQQVAQMIREARDLGNLAAMYEGWCAWV